MPDTFVTQLVVPGTLTTTLTVGQGPAGVGLSPGVFIATENISAGDFVNITAGGMRKASRTNYGRVAHGFVLSNCLIGAQGTVHFAGINTFLSGLTIGAVWLGIGGGVTSNPLSVGPGLVQQVGVASSPTQLIFQPGLPVALAGTPA